jgi:hypothetical protein
MSDRLVWQNASTASPFESCCARRGERFDGRHDAVADDDHLAGDDLAAGQAHIGRATGFLLDALDGGTEGQGDTMRLMLGLVERR